MNIIFSEIKNSKYQKYFFGILAIGLIFRILTLVYFGFGLSGQDLYEYGQIADSLFAGNGFTRYGVNPTCVMAPIYPYLLAGFYFIFGKTNLAYILIQILQIMLSLLTFFPLFYIAKKLTSEKIALITVLIFAIYPDFLYSVYAMHPITISTFAVVLIVYLFLRFIENYSLKTTIVLGLTVGFTLLLEPAIISIIILLLIFALFDINSKLFDNDKIKFQQRFSKTLIIAIITVIVISPWIIRNYYATDGHFVFIKHSGYNLFRGNNEHFTEYKSPDPYINKDLRNINKSKEYEQENRYRNYALKYMKKNIGATINNMLVKTYQFWWFPKITPQQSPLLRRILYFPLLIFAFAGIFFLRKKIYVLSILLIPIIGFNILYAITFVLPRYRIPVQPLLFILSAVGIYYIFDKFKKRIY